MANAGAGEVGSSEPAGPLSASRRSGSARARCRAGRIVGALLLLQMIAGYLVNFVLLSPLFGEPGFLVSAAAHPTRIGISVLLGAAMGLLTIAIAVTAFPVFRRHSLTLALLYLALAAASFALTVVEFANTMSLLSLSEAYARSDAAQRDLYQGLRIVVAASRNWAHYLELVVTGTGLLVLHATLFRFALVPRALAAFGMLSALLQMTAVSMPLLGREVIFPMLLPLGICQLVLAGWLLARGFGGAGSASGRVTSPSDPGPPVGADER